MKNIFVILVMALALLLSISCTDPLTLNDSADDGPIRTPAEMTSSELQLSSSSNDFGFNLYREVKAGSQSDENLFISPLSVSMALGMTLNGAKGETKDEMRQTLELAGMTQEQINQSYKSFIRLLTRLDLDVSLSIANSIWSREGLPVVDDFVSVNRDYFDALVKSLDFNLETAPDSINQWVSENTNGKIDKLIEGAIDPSTIMFLINAIHFKANWTIPFNPDSTIATVFNVNDAETVECDMMRKHDYFNTKYTNLFYALDLPYGDSSFGMYIILPHEEVGIDAVVASMTNESWNEWTSNLGIVRIELNLPKFKMECTYGLNDVLESLGMPLAFTAGADFSGIVPGGGVWISEVKHKTFVEVNEEGTEAAAVTQVTMTTSLPPDFIADRPFMFVIYERSSKTILFIGEVKEPVFE